MDEHTFTIGEGKERPPYTPLSINCPNCGSGLTIKSEHSELVVCPFCSSHLDVSEGEKKVLGKGAQQRKWNFVLELGDSFISSNQRYEVIARLVFSEDEDDPVTREYLLYNPFKGTLWLSEYEGEYSLFKDTHVMPTEDAFRAREGSTVKTHDNFSWRKLENGEYTLTYVDGALPWIATIGDTIAYAEFVNTRDKKYQYEAQRIANEVEYGSGVTLTMAQMAAATNKKVFSSPPRTKAPAKKTEKKKQSPGGTVGLIIGMALFFVVVNFVLMIMLTSSGKGIIRDTYNAFDLTNGVYTKSFATEIKNEIIKIDVYAPLDNAWMNLDIALVKDEDMVMHVDDAGLSYYSGYDGGEHWSEGSKSHTTYWKIPQPGTYRLLLHAVSASGNSNNAEQARHNITLKVNKGAVPASPFTTTIILSLVIGGIAFGLFILYKKGQSDD